MTSWMKYLSEHHVDKKLNRSNIMYIDTITIRNHKILGDVVIPLTRKTSRHVRDLSDRNIEIRMADSDKNRYTYIIGKNGAGKSTLFTTIINHIYGQMHPLMASVARALTYQARMSTSPMSYKRTEQDSDTFLSKNKNLRLIHISNSTTVLSEADFEEFIEIHSVSDNTSLRLLPLIYKGVERLDVLLSLINHTDGKWQALVSFADLLESPIEAETKGCMAILNGDKDINALSLISYIQDKKDKSINKSLVGNAISKASKGEIDTRCTSLKGICSVVGRSQVYGIMSKFFSEASDDSVVQSEPGESQSKMVFIPNMEDKESWIGIDFKEMNEHDLVAIPILVKMGILKFKITIDDVPINNMSSGERVMIGLFASLAKFAITKAENILMLYDEPENSLHPEWQQLFPLLFRNVVETVYGIKHSHFIFATHSPLIIQRANDISSNGICTVMKLSRGDGNIKAEPIYDTHRYCVEELMMDQFGVSYRTQKERKDMDEYLLQQHDVDPIIDVIGSQSLKIEIDQLYAELCKDE